jgi:hypothetical protein
MRVGTRFRLECDAVDDERLLGDSAVMRWTPWYMTWLIVGAFLYAESLLLN